MCNNNSLSFFHSLLGSIPRRLRRIISCHAELVSGSILKTRKCRCTASRTVGQVQGDVTNTPQLAAGMLYCFDEVRHTDSHYGRIFSLY